MLPNLLVIGAQKAGTTTIWHALDRHPDVFMSPKRETGFFYHDHLYNGGAPIYELNFFNQWDGQPICGEKTPEYLLHPKVPARIHSTLGSDIKLIAVLRNPAERAFSGYRHNLMMFRESLSFEDALNAEPERISRNPAALGRFGYLARGYYARHLNAYLSLFERRNILILFFEDLMADQIAEFNKVYEFLGIDSQASDDEISEGSTSAEPIRPGGDADDALTVRDRVIRKPSAALRAFSDRYNETLSTLDRPDKSVLSDINRRYFQSDIDELAAITSRNLDHWTES